MLSSIFIDAEKLPRYWEGIGYLSQIIFGSRFYVQWLASEKRKQSVVPVLFWWLSLVGSIMALSYAIAIASGPFILANIGGPPIYARNLWLIHKARRLPPASP
jgi:lipid-A-disaccharide synthase-like uncharacterized protein